MQSAPCFSKSKLAGHSQQMSLASVEPTLNPGTVPHEKSSQVGHKLHHCPYCTYKTNLPSSIKNHIRTHTGEKPFTCSYCSTSFTTKERLKTHIFIHTGEKPFACPYCSHRTSRKDSLRIHVLSFHIASQHWFVYIFWCWIISNYFRKILCLIWKQYNLKRKVSYLTPGNLSSCLFL